MGGYPMAKIQKGRLCMHIPTGQVVTAIVVTTRTAALDQQIDHLWSQVPLAELRLLTRKELREHRRSLRRPVAERIARALAWASLL